MALMKGREHESRTRNKAMVHYGDAKFAAAYAHNRDAIPEVIAALSEGARLTSRSQILEIGCGTGNYVGAISENTGGACYGLDRSEAMLRHARESAGRVKFLCADATRLAFADQSFDLVFSIDAIHHIAAHAQYYAEAHRVLRPHGWLCTMTHNEDQIRDYAVLSQYFPETVPIYIARFPTESALRASMERAGFREIAAAVVSQVVEVADSARYANRAYSVLHRISEDAFKRGLARLERDLAMGPIRGVRRYLALWGKK